MPTNKVYCFFGRQGSGKSTQAKLVSEKLNLPYFSAGSELRETSQDDSELGNKVRHQMSTGALVDDETMHQIFDNFLETSDTSRGLVTDGFPRNLVQLEHLKQLSGEKGWDLVAVDIIISNETAYERISKRVEMVNGQKIVRADDTPETLKIRLETYERETSPVVEEFNNSLTYIQIDGEPPIEQVTKEVTEKLDLHD